MNFITLLSTLAMAVGLGASLPQILRMVRTGSSGGQSTVGWGMGLVTNLSMAYVNLVGFHAPALMASNLVNAALCVAAILLIARFSASADLTESAEIIDFSPLRIHGQATPVVAHEVFTDMPTTEFVALREAFDAAAEQRELRSAGPRELAYAA